MSWLCFFHLIPIIKAHSNSRPLIVCLFVFKESALALLNSVLYYAPAFFLRKIIEFLELSEGSDNKSTALGYTYCAGLLIAMLLESIVSGQLWYISNSILCARVRIQLNTAIYAKTLRVSTLGGPLILFRQRLSVLL